MVHAVGWSPNHEHEVPFLRYVDASEHHRLKDFIEESAKASTPPRWASDFVRAIVFPVQLSWLSWLINPPNTTTECSCAMLFRSIHLQMRDSSGISFNAELFHVAVPSLTSEEAEHLIGISQDWQDPVVWYQVVKLLHLLLSPTSPCRYERALGMIDIDQC